MSAMTNTPAQSLAAMRGAAPLVQCITNYVAMNFAANVLLATGASPAMVHSPEESGQFAVVAGALTVNIGTLSPDWVEGMLRAAASARHSGRPWVLDPVAHFATSYRMAAIQKLLIQRPTIIRGNASEIIALAGQATAGKGVDSGDSVAAAEAAARSLAAKHTCTIAVTGEVDFVTDGARSARIEGGSPLMPLVTATGCALTALVGAFAAVTPEDPFEASVAGLATFAAAGSRAGAVATGPGSFAVAFLDALHALQPADLDSVKVEAA